MTAVLSSTPSKALFFLKIKIQEWAIVHDSGILQVGQILMTGIYGTIDGSVAITSYSVKGAYNVESFDGYGCKNCENCKTMILHTSKLAYDFISMLKSCQGPMHPHEDLSKIPALLSQDLSKIAKLNLPLLWMKPQKKGRYPRSGHCKKTKTH